MTPPAAASQLVRPETLRGAASEAAPQVVAWRRALHARPEAAYQERATASLAASVLDDLGMEVSTGVGGTTGVVGVLRGLRPGTGSPSMVVAIRADMDALPIGGADPKDVPYRARVEGVRHVCGHDAHVAMALGVAHVLTRLRDRWSGTVKFLFEPAEECLGTDLKPGAVALVEAGVLDNPAVDVVLALHVFPEYPAGSIAVRPGVIMTGMDLLDVDVIGQEAHSATPQKGADAIVAAAHVILALQTLASRETDPTEAVTVNIGTIEGGTGPRNVLAERVALRGLLRASDPALRSALPERVTRIGHHAAAALRARCEVRITPFLPHVKNDPALTERFIAAAVATLGPERVIRLPLPRLVGESFYAYSERVPSVFAFLGTGNPAKPGTVWPSHHPRFDIDEDALASGVQTLAAASLDLLKAPHASPLSHDR
ncbi:MAG: amidohydrolase [Chloroflexi bacterium]|nr:amidohydrolase [Chloroflexota bacterium]